MSRRHTLRVCTVEKRARGKKRGSEKKEKNLKKIEKNLKNVLTFFNFFQILHHPLRSIVYRPPSPKITCQINMVFVCVAGDGQSQIQRKMYASNLSKEVMMTVSIPWGKIDFFSSLEQYGRAALEVSLIQSARCGRILKVKLENGIRKSEKRRMFALDFYTYHL